MKLGDIVRFKKKDIDVIGYVMGFDFSDIDFVLVDVWVPEKGDIKSGLCPYFAEDLEVISESR